MYLIKIVAFMTFGTVIAHAQDTGPTLEDAKKHHLEMIDSRLNALNEAKTCVNGATTRDAVIECHKKLKEEHHDMKMKHMEHKKDRIEKRMEKMKK